MSRSSECAVPTFSLYRIYGRFGELLYVGQTTQSVQARTSAHARGKSWWALEAQQIYIETHVGVDALNDAEAIAIRDEDPKYNVQRGRKYGNYRSRGSI